MKILQFIHSLRRGGAERVVLDLSIGLVAQGHTVRICSISPVNMFEKELATCEGGPILCDSLFQKAKFRFLPNLPFLILRFRRIIEEFEPDVVHCHLRTDAAIASLIHFKPIVRTLHTSRPITPYKNRPLSFIPINWLERRSLSLSNVKIVACSRDAGEELGAYLTHKVHSVPAVIVNGRKLTRLQEIKTSEHKNIIAITGTLINVDKNQEMGIRALKILLDKNIDCTLWLLGDGPDRIYLENLVAHLDIVEHVVFFGEVNNVEYYLARASVYWVTSNFEGMPIALIEAMAAGLPVVATAAPGVREVFKDWPELLVNIDDHLKMAEITANLISDPQRTKEIISELKKYAFEKFSVNRMVDEYIQFYRNCLSCPGQSPPLKLFSHKISKNLT